MAQLLRFPESRRRKKQNDDRQLEFEFACDRCKSALDKARSTLIGTVKSIGWITEWRQAHCKSKRECIKIILLDILADLNTYIMAPFIILYVSGGRDK